MNGNPLKFFAYCVALIACSAMFVSCHDDEPESEPVEPTMRQTIIIYMVAENSLSSVDRTRPQMMTYAEEDSVEIASTLATLPDSTRVVLYMDDTKSSRICVGTSNQAMHTVRTYESNINSADSAGMEKVLTDIFSAYPSRHYGFVFWSHGSGWVPNRQRSPIRRTFGIDNNSRTLNNDGNVTKMEISTLARVLAHHPRTDYIFFDACFMQCIEVAYQLRNVTDYVLASPAELPANGSPYSLVLPKLATSGSDVLKALHVYYDYYYTSEGASDYVGVILSGIRTDRLEALAAATRSFAQRIFAERTTLDCTDVQRYFPINGSQQYTEYYDMVNLFYHYLSEEEFETWYRSFVEAVPLSLLPEKWASAFARNLLEVSDPEHCGAVSLFVPDERYDGLRWIKVYQGLDWYADTGMSTTGW